MDILMMNDRISKTFINKPINIRIYEIIIYVSRMSFYK